ncbi:efflux RND transporter periplasmic adaptor subunit [Caldimonas brevitalea]|uniref:Membrane-fusion protein n=1 Tax=Caldimonas brevitalea TaxID=413882 RepID=A0A0G3BQ36_9BURK|nr:efflux RND transporter periplasmic adaptor subunit [Caldimonas brevitalea]AKJ30098.1 membrane-fusion protein [Caldimonas brevitalea]
MKMCRVSGALAALSVLMATVMATPARASASAGEFDCMIEPAQVVEVRSPVVGLLQQVHVRRGESVRRGQLLVSIESSVEQSASETARFRAGAQGSLLLAQSKLRAAREKARRYEDLYEEEFVSAQARDDAAAELRTAQAELKTAEENAQLAKLEHRQSVDQLNRRVLRSPFDGVVVDQYLYPGALVDSGEGKKPILKIAQTDPLVVRAILPFRVFPQVKAGGAATVVPEAPFKGEVQTRIKTVDRLIDSAAGTFGVLVELDNKRQTLPGGIRCRLRIAGL